MKSHSKYNSLVVVVSVALLFSSSCHHSTAESRDQILNAATSQKGATTADSKNASDTDQRIKLLPVDEGSEDSSFQNFRNDLLLAVRNHDKDFIMRVLDPEINNGYDMERGVKEFSNRWRPEDPESSMWDVLSTILTGGGSFNERDGEREFCGPYVISQWPNVVKQLPQGTDSLEYVAITAKDVGVHGEPNLGAPVVATLSYDVVKLVPNSQIIDRSNAQFSSWVKIKTPTGQEGFVTDNYIQGPMNYGACFTRTNGRWVLSELAAKE